MSNLQVAIAAEYAEKMIKVTNHGGVAAFPMFPNATKHDLRMLQKEFKAFSKYMTSYKIDKKYVVIHVK